MSQYYYLVSTLSLLSYDSEHMASTEYFLEQCEKWLTAGDYLILKDAGISEFDFHKAGCALLDKWQVWEVNLRNELVKLRAQKKGLEVDAYLVEVTEVLGTADIAREAAAQESPLTAEELLNRARWSFLDDLEVGRFFTIEKLIIYYLRLQILERKRLFNREAGSERYKSIYQHITKEIAGEGVDE